MKTKPVVYVAVFLAGASIWLVQDKIRYELDQPDPPPSPDAQVIIDSINSMYGWERKNHRYSDALVHNHAGIYVYRDTSIVGNRTIDGAGVEFSRNDRMHIFVAFDSMKGKIGEKALRDKLANPWYK